MTLEVWTQVDRFFEQSFLDEDPILDEVLSSSDKAGLPPQNVSPCQGRLLQIFARMIQAKRILEIGTLGGYSTIWFARAISEDGRVVTIENNEHHARVAEDNLKKAGVLDRVTLLQGEAKTVLREKIANGEEPFDLIFIDADKPGNPVYLELSLQLAHPGTVIIGDNVVRAGKVTQEDSSEASVRGVREFCQRLKPSGLLSTAVQTVGVKGYDGFSISIVS